MLITLPFAPKVKGRPRFSRKGATYTDKQTVEYERNVALRVLEVVEAGGGFDGPVQVAIHLYNERADVVVEPYEGARTSLRGDIDNYAKAILDGLQKGGAFKNDRQVASLVVTK